MAERTFPERGLVQLIYTSLSLIPPRDQSEAVRQILIASITNNRRVDVTGLLVSTGEAFMQALEGPAASVRQTFDRVRMDPRHAQVEVKLLQPAERRLFKDWNMAARHLAGDQAVNLRDLDSAAALALLTAQRPAGA